jgi:ATP-binding cassette subfamily B protein
MAKHESFDDVPKVPLRWATVREAAGLLRYLWPYRLKFALAMALLFGGSLLGLGFPLLAGELVKAARAQFDGVAGLSLDTVALWLVGILIAQAVLSFLRAVLAVEVGERSLADLRRDTYARLIRLPMSFHHSRRVGELTSRLAADLSLIHHMLIDGFPHFLRQLILMVGGVALLLLTSVQLTLAMLITFPVVIVIAVVFGGMLRRVSKAAQDRLAESNVVVEETLQNITTVKAFTNEPFEQHRYGSALDAYVQMAVRGGIYAGAFFAFILVAIFGSIVFVLWYGAKLYVNGTIDEGGLTTFMLLTLFVGGAAGSFAELYSQFQRMLGASQRVREILMEPIEPAGGTPTPRVRGDVEFDAVRFRYPARPEIEVLRGVSLRVRPGERVALVGASGAGKSTLVSLLLRYFDPESGQIRVDGVPATEYDLATLRGQMAVVPQEVMLFGGTIAENIAYGRPGATRAEIEEAARRANAQEFIARLPEGYDTLVGERGVQLSGGQRQRIAIARAILRDPAILLLDEATSALDAESERLVLEALDRLMEGRTALVIAHRLSTVRGADRIFVLEQGQVVESGTHAELMDRPEGTYRTLSLLQLEAQRDESTSKPLAT